MEWTAIACARMERVYTNEGTGSNRRRRRRRTLLRCSLLRLAREDRMLTHGALRVYSSVLAMEGEGRDSHDRRRRASRLDSPDGTRVSRVVIAGVQAPTTLLPRYPSRVAQCNLRTKDQSTFAAEGMTDVPERQIAHVAMCCVSGRTCTPGGTTNPIPSVAGGGVARLLDRNNLQNDLRLDVTTGVGAAVLESATTPSSVGCGSGLWT